MIESIVSANAIGKCFICAYCDQELDWGEVTRAGYYNFNHRRLDADGPGICGPVNVKDSNFRRAS